MAWAGQFAFDLLRGSLRLAQRPRWRQPRVHHGPVELLVMVQQFLRAQPLEQHGRVVGKQDFAQLRVHLGLRLGAPLGDRQQAQVVIAQSDHGLLAQAVDQAQGFQRLPAAIDQVAAEPQAITCWVEAELVE